MFEYVTFPDIFILYVFQRSMVCVAGSLRLVLVYYILSILTRTDSTTMTKTAFGAYWLQLTMS